MFYAVDIYIASSVKRMGFSGRAGILKEENCIIRRVGTFRITELFLVVWKRCPLHPGRRFQETPAAIW